MVNVDLGYSLVLSKGYYAPDQIFVVDEVD